MPDVYVAPGTGSTTPPAAEAGGFRATLVAAEVTRRASVATANAARSVATKRAYRAVAADADPDGTLHAGVDPSNEVPMVLPQ